MADYQVPSQQVNHIPANTYPHHALHQLHGHNPHVAGDDLQDVHREGVLQPPVGNAVLQGEMQYQRHIDAPNYNVAPTHHHPTPPPYPEISYVHLHRDVGVVEAAPAQAYPFAPDVRENYDGLFVYGAQLPAAAPLEAFPGVWPHPAEHANMPLANGLRTLANRYLNNPDTHVNVLRIEPGAGGRFEVWIALELADIF